MLARLAASALAGVIAFLVSFVIIVIISAILPAVQIQAGFYATIIGVLVFFVYLFTGKTDFTFRG